MSVLDLYIGDTGINKILRVILLLLILYNFRGAIQSGIKKGTGYILLFLFMTVYCLFYSPITGDNFASMTSYYSYLNGADWENLHFERLYFDIMDLVPFGYVYYRLAVWGPACLLCVWLMRKMKISGQIATLSVLTFALPLLLYYQRAAFAYVLLYVALYCYISKGDIFNSKLFIVKKYYKLISLGLLLCTIPFHTTMPIYITFLLCALFIPKNKVSLILLFICIAIYSTSILQNSISLLNYFQEDTIETGLRSLEGDTGVKGQNFFGKLGNFLHWLPLYCMLVFGLYKMIHFPNYLTEFEKVSMINTLILLVVSLLFMSTSYTIHIKFRNAAMMPWTLFIASYFTRFRGNPVCTKYAIATFIASFV